MLKPPVKLLLPAPGLLLWSIVFLSAGCSRFIIRPGNPSPVPGALPGMVFVQLPAGEFLMGSPKSEDGRKDDEQIPTLTEVQAFEIMTTEVTQAMWFEIMETTPAQQRDLMEPSWPLTAVGENYPMYYISWREVQEFLRRLNECDPGKGYRLPTEVEWEYACRAGTETPYWNGSTLEDLNQVGWYDGNADSTIHEVAQLEPNPWGLYDMHGNAYEWCEDVYMVADGIVMHVKRGGDWMGFGRLCRSASRAGYGEDRRAYDVGFRVVRDAQR